MDTINRGMTNGVKRAARRGHAARGFTLLEMMLVVAIMGLLATVAVYSIVGNTETANIRLTRTRLAQLKAAVQTYFVGYGSYPPDLITLTKISPQLLERVPLDYWNTPFFYQYPGSSQDLTNQPFDLISYGPDKKPNTTDDLNIWTLEDR